MEEQDEVPKQQLRSYLWQFGELGWKLDELQQTMLNQLRDSSQNSKRVCITSSRQIGKSYFSVVFALIFLIQNPGKIARIIAPTRLKAQEIVEDNFNIISADAPDGFITATRSRYRWDLINGSSLRIGAGERRFVDSNRGGNASLIIYEEFGFLVTQDGHYLVNSVMNAQLLRSNGIEIFVSSPSENPEHMLHNKIMVECEKLGTLFSFNVFESTSIPDANIATAIVRAGCVIGDNSPAELQLFIDRMRAIDNKDIRAVRAMADKYGYYLSDDFMREYMAFVVRSATLMVIPHIHPKTFTAFEPWPWAKWQITFDWGGVRDLTVALLHCYEPNTDTEYFLAERVWRQNTRTGLIVDDALVLEGEHQIHVRRADVPGQLQVDLSDPNGDYKYPVSIPQKSDWMASVKEMANRTAQGKVRVHPQNCPFLMRSIKGGIFNKHRTDFERDNTEDGLGHMDGLAAMMYAIRSSDISSGSLKGADKPKIHQGYMEPVHALREKPNMIQSKPFGPFKKRMG